MEGPFKDFVGGEGGEKKFKGLRKKKSLKFG